MKDFLATNWKTIGAALLFTAAFGLSYFPALEKVREYIVGLGWLLGVFNTVFVPSFVKSGSSEG